MQINSAQDYLTLKKRQIIAATFTQNPPPVKRRNNTIVTALLANKATGYEKVPYAISLAPGSVPGPAYVTAGIRPTVNNCCIQPMASTTIATTYSYLPNITGAPNNNTVATLLTSAYVASSGYGQPSLVSDSLGNLYYWNTTDKKVYKIPVGTSTMTPLAQLTGNGDFIFPLSVDSSNNIWYLTTTSTDSNLGRVNPVTGAITIFTMTNGVAILGNTYGAKGPVIDSLDRIYMITNNKLLRADTTTGLWTLITLTGGIIVHCYMGYNKVTDSIIVAPTGTDVFSISLTGVVSTFTTAGPSRGYSTPSVLHPSGTFLVSYDSFQISGGVSVNNSIAGTGSTGNVNGAGGSAQFGTTLTNGGTNTQAALCFGPDGTLYIADVGNTAIRTIKGPTVTIPSVTTYYPNAGALI